MNLFLGSTDPRDTVTFLTNAEACAGADTTACNSNADPNQLAIDPTTHAIATGHVTIAHGLHLLPARRR